MNLLVDLCAGARLAGGLRGDGHRVEFVGDWPSDPGDSEILRIALDQERVVVTRDKDFGTLSVLGRHRHCGIIRLVELRPEQELPFCLTALEKYTADLKRGCLVTVEIHRIRVREPDWT
ncbi:MAG: toxin-antitoxin system, toxin component, PIN family protein [Pedosphaera sp.]|nr:toxin-antitoxin system, toxin component, PIN family protein [Pedosphaera sp.]